MPDASLATSAMGATPYGAAAGAAADVLGSALSDSSTATSSASTGDFKSDTNFAVVNFGGSKNTARTGMYVALVGLAMALGYKYWEGK